VQQAKGRTAIQRDADSDYEAWTGVGAAIAAGTMTPDAGINRQTFTATDLNGISGCNVTFRARRGFTGTYNLHGNAARRVRGVYVSVSARHTPECGTCARTELVQVVRGTREVAGTLETTQPTSAVRETRAGWGDPAAPSRGWRVDAQETETRPFISQNVQDDRSGSDARSATLHDAPGFWTASTDRGLDFHTCYACFPTRRAAGIPMACLHWGFYVDAAGAVNFRPNPFIAIKGPTQAANDATLRWGRIPGNRPARIDWRLRPRGPTP
jgi:hypothetical protein